MSLLQCKNEKVSSLELLLNVNQYAVKLKSKMDKLSAVKKIQKAGANAKIKNFIIHGGGHGVHPKRTEVMLFKKKSEGSRDGRNSPLFEQKVSNVLSAGTCTLTAAQNSKFIENELKCAERRVGTFSILRRGRGLQRYSSTGGGDSRGFTVAHKVDSQAIFMSENIKLQFKSEGRFVSSAVLAMRHSICSICRLRYSNGAAVLLVVTILYATARIILLIIVLFAVVCHFYIICIYFHLSVTCFCLTPELRRCPSLC